MAGLSITDMDLTNGSRSVPRYRSISLRSVYESAASFISGVGSPTNYCAATRTGTASAFGPGTIRRGGIGLDHVVGVHWGIDLELLHMRLGRPGIEAMYGSTVYGSLAKAGLDGLDLDGLIDGLICIIY